MRDKAKIHSASWAVVTELTVRRALYMAVFFSSPHLHRSVVIVQRHSTLHCSCALGHQIKYQKNIYMPDDSHCNPEVVVPEGPRMQNSRFYDSGHSRQDILRILVKP